jgi:putative phosphoesterase
MRAPGAATIIGVISDTLGLVRPEALSALDGSSLIVHAGDIGHEAVLEALGGIAPVYPVRGNNDRGPWAEAIPETRVIEVGGVGIYVLHDRHELVTAALAANIRIVVSGHSHRPVLETRNGILYLNPGSAGPRRFKLPISVARIVIQGRDVFPALLDLTARSQDLHRMGRPR